MRTRIVVIGNGTFAINCLKIMLGTAGIIVALVLADPEPHAMLGGLPRFCRNMKLPLLETVNINAPTTIEAVRSARPDFLFSIYNMRIMKSALRRIPHIATVNFHNGPLPRYRGVNVYSWAIFNGETEHGVTWHLVDEGVDTGDILGQRMFPVDARDTPVTLLAKGFGAGTDLFGEMFPQLIAGRIAPRPQDHSAATYYAKRDLPNGGRISFEWKFDQIERFVRGLDYRPFENGFVYPTASFRGTDFHLQSVRQASSAHAEAPGRIVRVSDDSIHVRVADAVAALSHLLDSRHQPVSPRQLQTALEFSEGDILN